jgi:quercetin dioxygenase-like cupin family protein
MDIKEEERARSSECQTDQYARRLEQSQAFRREDPARREIVKAEDMPVETSPQGLLKHMVNEEMNTREYCLDIYQQFLAAGGRSGKHRHLSEEVLYILEGQGYDLHWDVRFDCQDTYIWDWEKEPQKFAWEEGDFVYIPPYCAHQHFNADPSKPARFISVTSRIVKAIGFDWIDQLENAPEYSKP